MLAMLSTTMDASPSAGFVENEQMRRLGEGPHSREYLLLAPARFVAPMTAAASTGSCFWMACFDEWPPAALRGEVSDRCSSIVSEAKMSRSSGT